jgi:hypothetical protein
MLKFKKTANRKQSIIVYQSVATSLANPRLQFVQQATAEVRSNITRHPMYRGISNLKGIRTMMEHHVYAVWDFMSLLKSLQSGLTCVSVPWFPRGHAETRFFINEIVLGEESDVDPEGTRISHFELYLKAMEQAGANTSGIRTFIDHLQQGGNLEGAFHAANTPEAARTFVRYTLQVATNEPLHVVAAVFTFGREDLIPDMFLELIREIKAHNPKSLELLSYYLERHIEVDGDHHGPLSWNMVQALCGEDNSKWAEAAEASVAALQHRQQLWNAVHALL